MTAVDEHRPGYRGQLSDAVPTLAELLKEGGYHTYMTGKWHLTLDGNFSEGRPPNGSWPTQRGFDAFYGTLSGGKGYFTVKWLFRNTKPVHELPEDYYYTEAISEESVRYIRNHDATQPLFLYIAHYAPHFPLEAPEERIDRYRERYGIGKGEIHHG